MKTKFNISKLLWVGTVFIALVGCNSKTDTQDSNHTTAQAPITQVEDNTTTLANTQNNGAETKTKKPYTKPKPSNSPAPSPEPSILPSTQPSTSPNPKPVIDSTPPVIHLNGIENIDMMIGDTYTELGAMVIDNKDSHINVKITGTVDTSKAGEYTIIYSATDSAGNEATRLSRIVHVKEKAVVLTAITIDKTNIELAEGNKTTLTLTANYDNNTTKDVTATVVWQVANATIASIDTNGTLNALAEGNTTLQASYEGKTSDSIVVTVYKEINGYRLPLEPDPVVNNATLLGVDSNDNGVRDDVERYIVKTYKDKHPIHVDIAMQAARGYKLVLETPERAKEIHDTVNASLYCELYYRSCVDDTTINEKRILSEDGEIDSKYFRKKIYFNTEDRYKAYLTYDNLLSGDSYTLLRCKNRKEKCDFNTAQYEE